MCDELKIFDSKHSDPKHVHVDDCVHSVVGSLEHVEDQLVKGAILWSNATKKLKLILSPKSTIVSSSVGISKRVSVELASYGIEIQWSTFARDLGVNFTGGRTRVTSIVKDRLNKAKRRNVKVTNLARSVRGARKLFNSGVYPQATWGHECVGLSDSMSLSLRRMAANATGIKPHGRCTTTVIFMSYGNRSDPKQRLAREVIIEYFNAIAHFDTPYLAGQACLCLGPSRC